MRLASPKQPPAAPGLVLRRRRAAFLHTIALPCPEPESGGADGDTYMTMRMLIDARHQEETRVAVLKGNRIEEFDFESAEH